MGVTLRQAVPNDHTWIVDVVDDWWGRSVSGAVPQLFLDHFCNTSIIAQGTQGPVGFLIGFHSPARPESAYIHFVGVDPRVRRQSVARGMYEEFFQLARQQGRSIVSAITSPGNSDSIAFHRKMGFVVGERQGSGSNTHAVTFTRRLT